MATHSIDFTPLKNLALELVQPTALVELAVLAGCLLLAWWVVHTTRARSGPGRHPIWLGASDFDGVMFPVLALVLALIARVVLDGFLTVAVFQLAVPILVSLLVIRLTVRVLGSTFPNVPAMRVFERSVSWLAWVAVVLWVTGILPWTLDAMEEVQWKIGARPVTLLTLVQGAITAVGVMMAALWLSSAVERKLLAHPGHNVSMRKMFANIARVLLLFVGLLLALSAMGIDLTALSVLSGAVGVGLGLGLQRIASNYVSGFIILAEGVLNIGDLVKVDGFEGRITDIRTRYSLIKADNGRESVVPNEMLVISRVENASLMVVDPKTGQASELLVEHGTDVRALLPALVAAMAAVPDVLADPPPLAEFSAFTPDGLQLTLQFWMTEGGAAVVKSAVNLAVLDALAQRGVHLALPQRRVHADPAA